MSINKIRTILYFIARILGDINAVQKGKIGQRIGRRILGKIFGRIIGKIFK
jgi:tetrahydromethanopterin S-methyltransferase subunit G